MSIGKIRTQKHHGWIQCLKTKTSWPSRLISDAHSSIRYFFKCCLMKRVRKRCLWVLFTGTWRRWRCGTLSFVHSKFARFKSLACSFYFIWFICLLYNEWINWLRWQASAWLMHKTWVRSPGLLHFNIIFHVKVPCSAHIRTHHALQSQFIHVSQMIIQGSRTKA